MKVSIVVLLLLTFVSMGLGQTTSPSPSPLSTRTKSFGSSLEKYDKKKDKKSQNEQKQAVAQRDNEDIIRVETDLVVHDVLVTDQAGNVISGLTKSDLVVLEDGVPQSIEIFSSGTGSTIPRSIVLIIDCALPQTPYLEMSTKAAKVLVDQLRPQDKMAIVTTDVIVQIDFTADRPLLKQALDHVERKGRELVLWYERGAKSEERDKKSLEHDVKYSGIGGQFGTLMAVLNEMFDEPGRQRIVLFQGEATHVIGLKPDKDLPYPVSHATRMNSGMKYTGANAFMSKFGFGDVKDSIIRSQASVYSIITGIRFFGLPEKERVARAKISWENVGKTHGWKNVYSPEQRRMYEDREEKVRTAGQAAMYRVAELSGGNTAVMEKPEDAERVYSDIFAVIKNRHVLGYYPTDSKKGEKRRNVKVEVRGHPEYTITGRNAYILK